MGSAELATWVGSIAVALTLLVTAWAVAAEAVSRRRERVRGQAESIAAWFAGSGGEGTDELAIANSSMLPIYEVVTSLVFVQGAAPGTIEDWRTLAVQNDNIQPLSYGAAFTAIGPGNWRVVIPSDWGTMMARPSCEIGFTDAAGRHWVRRGTGRLVRIRRSAVDHYGIARPVDFQPPLAAG